MVTVKEEARETVYNQTLGRRLNSFNILTNIVMFMVRRSRSAPSSGMTLRSHIDNQNI